MLHPKEVYNQHSIYLFSRPNIKIELSVYSWKSTRKLVCKSVDFTAFDATYKINPVDIMQFINELCMHVNKYYKIQGIKHDATLNLHEHHFVIETIRDIYSGVIANLLRDDSVARSKNIVSFGFLGKENSKPQREHYIELCKDIPFIDYINTGRYCWVDSDSESFVNLLDVKPDYKYLIDLQGHTYSTKSYLFLASKRVYFSSRHNVSLWWEKEMLKPWENYVPVAPDLSDLQDKFHLIESKPELYDQIVANNLALLQNQLSPDTVLKRLVAEILTHIDIA